MVDASFPDLRRLHEERTQDALAAFFADQAAALRPAVGDGLASFDRDRWNRALAAAIYVTGKDTATDYGQATFSMLGRSLRFQPDLMDPWLQEWSDNAADSVNDMVFASVEDTILAEDPLEEFDGFFEGMVAVRAGLYARTMVTTTGNFGAHDGARAGGATMKKWVVTSGNPRSTHASLSGDTILFDTTFRNGLKWPGDPSGDAAELANCRCALEFA